MITTLMSQHGSILLLDRLYERLLILEAQQPKQREKYFFVGELGQALTIDIIQKALFP